MARVETISSSSEYGFAFVEFCQYDSDLNHLSFLDAEKLIYFPIRTLK